MFSFIGDALQYERFSENQALCSPSLVPIAKLQSILQEKNYTQSNDQVEININTEHLVYRKFGQGTKLVRISETDFLPKRDLSFKISFDQ